MARVPISDVFSGLVAAVKDAQRVLAERHLLHLTDYFQPAAGTAAEAAAAAAGGGTPAPLVPRLLRFLVPARDRHGNSLQQELAVPLAAIVNVPELQIKTVDVEFEARLDAPTGSTGRDGPSSLAEHLLGQLDRLADRQQLDSKLHLEMKGSMFSSSMPLAKIKVTLEVREHNEALSRLTDHYLKNL